MKYTVTNNGLLGPQIVIDVNALGPLSVEKWLEYVHRTGIQIVDSQVDPNNLYLDEWLRRDIRTPTESYRMEIIDFSTNN